jgi:hypothetical protein
MAALPVEQQIAEQRHAFRYSLDPNGEPVLPMTDLVSMLM